MATGHDGYRDGGRDDYSRALATGRAAAMASRVGYGVAPAMTSRDGYRDGGRDD